ncbi:MAG: DNA-directed RNA polymerase subunit N [Candidatus Diapherotrites archaeon]|nr:DNA-directed RNA polymerase subunit N [Candidatus Diapherotrites archaeon]
MLMPPRCFSCGKELGSKYEEFQAKVSIAGDSPDKVLDDMGITRYCCRRMLFTHVDLADEIMAYPKF